MQLIMSRKKIKPTRFGDLPDEILGHICSFLPIKDLIRVGSLSKRYSKLHLSTLSLSLDKSPDASISTCDRRKQLLGSFERYLIRRGCSKLQCFRFSWCYHDHDQGNPQSCCPKDLKSWMVKFIDYAVRCNVEELHLKMNIDSTQIAFMEFPAIRCGALRNLSAMGMSTNIKTFLSSSFPNLERLELTLVSIPDVEIFKWISDSCKSIKELWLEDIYGIHYKNASIVSSSLKSFTFILSTDYPSSNFNLFVNCENLEDTCIVLGEPFFTGKYVGTLCFTTPNLKILRWCGYLMLFQNCGEVKSLEKVEIELDPEINDLENVLHLFHSVQGAKVLDLTETTMNYLYIEGLTPEELELHDVCCLRIRDLSLMDDDVPAMIHLLTMLPNLVSLHIEAGRQSASRYNSSSYGHYSDWDYYFDKAAVQNLKEVTIQLSTGDNGIGFTRYIIRHALELQKMVIYYLPEHYNEVKRYKWPSDSNAEVIFQEREDQYESVDTHTVSEFLDGDDDPLEQVLIDNGVLI